SAESATSEDRDKPADVADSADAAEHGRDELAAGNSVRGSADGGDQVNEPDDGDYEPYLPPRPNPFSSVPPQGGPAPEPPVGSNGGPGPAAACEVAASEGARPGESAAANGAGGAA